MNLRHIAFALSFAAFGCSTTSVTKFEATNDLISKICAQAPDKSQPPFDIYMTTTGEWRHGAIRCTAVTGVSPDNMIIPILQVPAAPPEKPVAMILLNHQSGTPQAFPINLAGVLAKLEGGTVVKYVHNDPRTPGIEYTAYIY